MKAAELFYHAIVQPLSKSIGSPCQVICVDYERGLCDLRRISDNIVFRYVPCTALAPITLTPEILEKNGWKKVGEDERTGVPIMQIEYDGNAFWWTEMNGECGCEDVENEDGEEKFVKVFSCVQVCYVHELQHALRLRRIEKEIVL